MTILTAGGNGNDTQSIGQPDAGKTYSYYWDGGGGTDTLDMGDGESTEFSWAFNGTSWIIDSVTGASTWSMSIEIKNVEKIKFNNTTVTLTAGDTTAPTVSTFSPADEATGVAVAANIVITFSEAVSKGTGLFTLRTAGGTVETFDVATSTKITGWGGTTLTINPTSDLAGDTIHYLDIAATAVKDASSNAYAGVTTYNFRTVVVNTPPTLANAIPDQAATEDAPFTFEVAVDAFADADPGNTFTYAATREDGSALPAWLTFNKGTLAFSGTPANADVGPLSVKVTATDSGNATVFDTFTLTVANVNDAPTLTNAIPDKSASEDSIFSFQFASNAFTDIDVGDSLTYIATQADDSALPGWLTFTPGTRTFSGTPVNADVGALTLKVIATDTSAVSVSDTFKLTVANVNDAPTLANAIPDQGASKDTPFTFQFASNTFADVDAGDTLSYTATRADGSALPGWLGFTSATRTFSGTPLLADVTTLNVKVTATDSASATVTDTFAVVVTGSNTVPTVVNAIPDKSASEDALFSFQFAANVFSDADAGDTLNYAATMADGSALPGWLSFTPGTRTFSGTPTNADVGPVNLKVTATDTALASVSDTFTVSVANVNDTPTVANAIPDQGVSKGTPFNFQFASNTFADVDAGDSLSYAATRADGSALPVWLSFTPATRAFSGVPSAGDVGVLSLKVTATDVASATVTDTFAITVTSANTAPTVANAIPDKSASEDTAFTFQFASNAFADADAGDTLTYSATLADGSALPGWLSFTPGTRTFSGTPANADVGPLTLKVTATDSAQASVSDTFALTVANVNDAPSLVNAVPDQGATQSTPFSFQFAANTFADIDQGDTLTYTATRADGSALPAWLSFAPATRTFSGTPTAGDTGTFDVKVTASDGASAAVTDTFAMTVSGAQTPGVSVEGGAGADTLTGSAGADTISGLAGADLMTGGAGDDHIDGGSNLITERDVASYAGPIADYLISRTGPTTTVAAREGNDTVINVERLLFTDMSVNLTVQATAASIPQATLDRICELYVGFFGRVPAADGLENWIRQFNNGKTIFQIADDFYGIGSGPDLRGYTGYWDLNNNTELSNKDYVTIVYRNVLGREGKAGGINYWSGQLDSGAETRGSLVCKMLDSADTYEGDATWGWVADLVDDKVVMSKRVAIDWGLNYSFTAEGAIAKGMAIAGAVDQTGPTPGFPDIPIKVFDFADATAIVGVNPSAFDLIA